MSTFDEDISNAKRLLDALGTEHPKYLDSHTLYKRLGENISNAELYGDTNERAALRTEIRRGLDKISLEVHKCTMDELGRTSSPPQVIKSFSHPQPEAPKSGKVNENKDGKAIFISHSSKDEGFVLRLANDLTKAGFKIWHDDKNIKVSQSIPGEVSKGLTECEYFVIVLTPEAVASHWVQREIDAALMGKKTIVPVLLKDCDRPALIQANKYADFRTDYQSGLKGIMDALPSPLKEVKADEAKSPEVLYLFELLERACYNGDLLPEQGKSLKKLITGVAMKKLKGEIPMPPTDSNNTGEMLSYASQVLIHDLLSLSNYHTEWPNMVVSDRFKKDSIKLLKKMQDQILVSSALVQQIGKFDPQGEIERVLTPLQSLQSIL
jgi:hypothetical protein